MSARACVCVHVAVAAAGMVCVRAINNCAEAVANKHAAAAVTAAADTAAAAGVHSCALELDACVHVCVSIMFT